MMSKSTIAALAAAAGLIWGSAHAAPEGTEQAPAELPGVIIFELTPTIPGEGGAGSELGATEQEQAMMAMLLLQLMSVMQAEGDTIEVQQVAPSTEQRI